jgi:hypothetical protein
VADSVLDLVLDLEVLGNAMEQQGTLWAAPHSSSETDRSKTKKGRWREASIFLSMEFAGTTVSRVGPELRDHGRDADRPASCLCPRAKLRRLETAIASRLLQPLDIAIPGAGQFPAADLGDPKALDEDRATHSLVNLPCHVVPFEIGEAPEAEITFKFGWICFPG